MDFNSFGCEKRFIEGIHRTVQRDVLIQEYCGGNFAFINLVDFFYRSAEGNAILMFLFICIIYPILFLCVAAIADKYLATGMQDLSIRFGLSPTIAAITLIAFANGAPDVLASLSSSGKEGGMFIALGSLFGGYVFSACLVISNVAVSVPDPIKLPKYATLKEFLFFFTSVVVVCIFGFIGTAGYAFVGCYMTVYVLYLISSIVAEKYDDKSGEGIHDSEFSDLEGKLDAGEEDKEKEDLKEGEEKKDGDEKIEEEKDEEVKNSKKDGEGEGDEKKDSKIEMSEKDSKKEDEKEEGFLKQITNELNDDEASSLESAVLFPLLLAGLFTVCYLENPFMKLKATKFFIIAFSIFFFLWALELTGFSELILISIGGGIALVALVCELTKLSQNVLDIIYELTSVFAAIGWISIFSGVIIDFISFLAFYFSINEIILSSLLLSAGNTIGDFFGNAALAKAGEPIMGAIAAYSGQIFNNFIGFSVNVLSAASIGDTAFDIFALDYYKGEDAHLKPAPLGNYFLMCVIATVVLVIILSVVYYSLNDFTLGKKFTPILVSVYGVFFVGSMTFGILSRS